MPANSQLVEDIFDAALRREPGKNREDFLDEACGEDTSLRNRVVRLLRAAHEAGSFLETPATDLSPTRDHLVNEKAGDAIGPYKLLQQIGEGGMGVVYMAEQSEPIERRVALKIIKPGMDTRQVIARFEAERQALTMMDHPNIAKALDAGVTDTGRPYFVMELVKGIPITEYCDKHCLSPRERLELFTPVCQAIQHAHQKGIIHRDVKPSNVLIAEYDDQPAPKVIDFGVAKAIDHRLTERTLFTEFGQVLGTFEYMSPEQAKLNQWDVDTRTDIYSLGVLLYELLSGETPFDRERLRSAAIDELFRIIREEEPPRPSTRASSSQSLPAIAANRKTDPIKLSAVIRGELDWIVMKACEKDRSRRYETANGLSRDIERYLHDEPVHACPPSAAYRIRKFVRRNKAVFATAAVIASALLVATGVSIWLAGVARKAEALAEARLKAETVARQQAQYAEARATDEAVRSRQIAQFMTDMLKGVGPSVALGRDTTMLQEILDQTAGRLNELQNQPAVEADLRTTLGNVYRDLGQYKSAETMHREALALRRNLLGDEHRDVAASLHDLGEAVRKQDRVSEAEPLLQQALEIRRRLLGEEHPDVGQTLFRLGLVFNRQGDGSRAEPIFRQALALQRKFLNGENPDFASSLGQLGIALSYQGKYEEAETVLRQSLALRKKVLAKGHPGIAGALHTLGRNIRDQGKLEEAEAMLRQALAMRRELLGKEHPDVANSLKELAKVLQSQGKVEEAAGLFREALLVRGETEAPNLDDIATSVKRLTSILISQGQLEEAQALIDESPRSSQGSALNKLGYELAQQGKIEQAEAVYRQALELQEEFHGRKSREAAAVMNKLAMLLTHNGKLSEGESLARETIQILENIYGDDHHTVSTAWHRLAAAFEKQGKLAEAEQAYLKARRIDTKLNLTGQQRSYNAFWIRLCLGNVYYQQGRYAEAEEAIREAVALARTESRDRSSTFSSIILLASVLQAQGKSAEAEAVYREELSIWQELENPDEAMKSSEVAKLRLYLGKLLLANGRHEEATNPLVEAAKYTPPWELNRLAWSLATDPDPLQRDGPTAVLLAEKAVEGTERKEANFLDTLAAAYAEQGEFTDAVQVQQEAIALLPKDNENMRKDFESRLQLFESDLPYRDHGVIASRALTFLQAGRFQEAESIARECLVLREQLIPDDWRTFNAHSMLGGSLLGQEAYDDAEPLLVTGLEGMIDRESEISEAGKVRITEALQRLVELYESRNAKGDMDKAAQYRDLLEERSTVN